MTPKQALIQFISDYWDIALVPAGMWFMHWWTKRKFTLIVQDAETTAGNKPSQDQCDQLLAIVATQTRILEKLDKDVEALNRLSSSMKEEDTRIRDNFTKCLDKISEGTDALVSMFKEYRAFEKGRAEAARA